MDQITMCNICGAKCNKHFLEYYSLDNLGSKNNIYQKELDLCDNCFNMFVQTIIHFYNNYEVKKDV